MSRLSSIACVAVFGALSLFACSKDEKPERSQLGESCERTADCADSLACFGGTCRPADANVSPSTKECKVLQCEAAADCCTVDFQPATNCATAKAACDASATSTYCAIANGPQCKCEASKYACEEGFCKDIQCNAPEDCCAGFVPSASCTTYAAECAADPASIYCDTANGSSCKCDATTKSCTNNVCSNVETCMGDEDCSSGVCSGGRCVACAVDSDCNGSGYKCLANACKKVECLTNVECPAFSECQEDNTCKAVGCETDRECMTYLDSYLATCNKKAEPVPTCVIACERDAQCHTESNPLSVCVDGRCQDPGCETDEECKLTLSTSDYAGYRGVRVICAKPAK
jgi:hypothetical protein